MDGIAARRAAVLEQLAQAANAAGRDPASVSLLAVSKTWPAETLRAAWDAGQRAFGENYVQEAADKVALLADLPIEWHFIGPLQSNKTRLVAAHFAWVHSIDRLRVAQRLNAQRTPQQTPLQVCIQVNVSGEASKSGVEPHEVEALARALQPLDRLRLRGLMCIPEPSEDPQLLRERFASLRHLREALQEQGICGLDTLSMGMSHDFSLAIAEGATLVRVGTAIFGTRSTPDPTLEHGVLR